MDRSTADESGTPTGSSLSVAVVEAVAEREAIDPLELERPLHDVVDTDALERLFPVDGAGGPGSDGYVSFVYEGRLVRVSSDREVRIVEPGAAGNGWPGDGDQ